MKENFVELTTYEDGTKVWVNLENVAYIEAKGDMIIIRFPEMGKDGNFLTLYVKENPLLLD